MQDDEPAMICDQEDGSQLAQRKQSQSISLSACGNYGDMLVLATAFVHAAIQNKLQNLR